MLIFLSYIVLLVQLRVHEEYSHCKLSSSLSLVFRMLARQTASGFSFGWWGMC
jgi:hypothetical protein